jgi:acetoin:2,6-dichlorophenolindophenol oxidoreductase subunit alpha
MMATRSNIGPSNDQLVAMYERMLLVRRMEERLRDDNAAGKLPGAVHLYIGQEACAVGVCAHLDDKDWITSTHRGHGHFLAKGGDPKAMMAEIWAKRTGICKGMGGSMHVADVSKGILGANGIVGGGFAIATGAAFAAKLDGKGRVAACFFGDGASNQGVFMETMNVSSVWGLPIVFMCENNQFSEFTPSKEITAGEIADRARAFMPVAVVDGNDVTAVWRAAAEAIDRARSGEGPSFIEAKTYRIRGHIEAEPMMLGGGKYREDAEIAAWTGKCPVARLRAHLIETKVTTAALEAIEARVAGIVDDAVAYAEAGEPADPELSFDLMFAGHRA